MAPDPTKKNDNDNSSEIKKAITQTGMSNLLNVTPLAYFISERKTMRLQHTPLRRQHLTGQGKFGSMKVFRSPLHVREYKWCQKCIVLSDHSPLWILLSLYWYFTKKPLSLYVHNTWAKQGFGRQSRQLVVQGNSGSFAQTYFSTPSPILKFRYESESRPISSSLILLAFSTASQ